MKKLGIIVFSILSYAAWAHFHTPTPTTISLRIGQTFHEVVNGSTFPVMNTSNIPDERTNGNGATWITKPAVIIHFNDPQYEFTLPPTTFAAVDYMNYRVSTISTSPSLRKLPFEEALTIARSLQGQLQQRGWQPQNDTTWLDLGDKNALHRNLSRNDPAYRNYVELVVPAKYSMIFRFYCSERCDSHIGLDRYLIDIGVAEDLNFRERATQAVNDR